MKNSYVYIHINPIKNEIFYVGIGCTESRATSKHNRTKFWHNVVNKYGYVVEIIHSKLTWEQACENEKYYIRLIGRRSLNKGPLVNLTDGGDGNLNPSEEIREKIRNAQLGRKGYKHTEVAKQNMSKAQLGSKRSDIGKINMSKARLGMKFSEEHKTNMSQAAKTRQTINFSGEHKDSTKELIRQKLSNISLELKNQILVDLDSLTIKEIGKKYNVKIGQIYHIRSKYKLIK